MRKCEQCPNPAQPCIDLCERCEAIKHAEKEWAKYTRTCMWSADDFISLIASQDQEIKELKEEQEKLLALLVSSSFESSRMYWCDDQVQASLRGELRMAREHIEKQKALLKEFVDGATCHHDNYDKGRCAYCFIRHGHDDDCPVERASKMFQWDKGQEDG